MPCVSCWNNVNITQNVIAKFWQDSQAILHFLEAIQKFIESRVLDLHQKLVSPSLIVQDSPGHLLVDISYWIPKNPRLDGGKPQDLFEKEFGILYHLTDVLFAELRSIEGCIFALDSFVT